MTSSALERLLRHDRALVLLFLLGVVALSWAYLLSGAGMMEDMGGMRMPMSSGPWSLGHAAVVTSMWAVMMAAMMLPSAAPMILFYAAIARRGTERSQSPARPAFFAIGYVAVWAIFSLMAVTLQFGLERASLLSPMMQTTSIALAGAVLITAGLYQWLPLKQTCLKRCRSPLEFVMLHWQQGLRGAFAMGFRHGVYCVGCCWALMLLLFAGGIMNIGWIAGLSLFILIEKTAPAGHWIGRIAGGALIAWGTLTLLGFA